MGNRTLFVDKYQGRRKVFLVSNVGGRDGPKMRRSEANKEGGMCDQKILGSKRQNYNLQGDHSGCVKPPVDIKTKVPF